MRKIVFVILLLCIPLSFAICSQVNETYVCVLPVSIAISETPKEYTLLTENITSSGSTIVELQIFNKEDTQTYEVYAYAYTGKTCVSCIEEKNESMFEVDIEPQMPTIVEIPLHINRSGTFDFKVRVKKQNLKTWTDLQGTITVEHDEIGNTEEENTDIIPETEITPSEKEQTSSKTTPVTAQKSFAMNSSPTFVNKKENTSSLIFILLAIGALITATVVLIKKG